MLWLGLGAASVVASLVLAVNTVGDLVKPAELTGVPRCTAGPSEDCLTRAPATVERETNARFGWLSGERKWLLDVSAVPPELRGNGKTRVTVPEQPGRDEIRDDTKVTVVYHGGNLVLLELPGGGVLETDEHPRIDVPTMGYLAVGMLGAGAFAVMVGWRNGRGRSWWSRVDYEQPKDNASIVAGVLFFAGGAGVITQTAAGSSRWPAFIVAIVVAGALSALIVFAKRRRAVRAGR